MRLVRTLGGDMERLAELEAKSVSILREAYNRIEPLFRRWSLGKD